jgi:hypothetical protein
MRPGIPAIAKPACSTSFSARPGKPCLTSGGAAFYVTRQSEERGTMAHRRTISLDGLAQSRKSEIEEMLDGIEGKPGSALWTSEIRATTRGGSKCMAVPVIEQAR